VSLSYVEVAQDLVAFYRVSFSEVDSDLPGVDVQGVFIIDFLSPELRLL
jgi:hypothetical protein